MLNIRNIAIVAHVDHGKTTLVDRLLQQTDRDRRLVGLERALDQGELERERGITILAKTTAIEYQGCRINIVDTPGHADFGGEVERILSMVDSVLLLVDAAEGPMPQTRFVTAKAFAAGLKPILVVNKIDRDGAEPHAAVDKVFDLFDALGASEEQLDFPVMFASALQGVAGPDPEQLKPDVTPLLDLIVERVPPPTVDGDGPFRMQVSTLDYSSYVGVIGIGRVSRGRVKPRDPVNVVNAEGNVRRARVLEVQASRGLARVDLATAVAGDIVALSGIDDIEVSDTICAADSVDPLPRLAVDEPTLTMTFVVNSGPFAGKEGRFLTARHLRERLFREATHNVALRVADTDQPDRFQVSGRGELHLSVLIETMRREGYEMAVTQPSVITREEEGRTLEPWEAVVFDIDLAHQGALMETLGERRGDLLDMEAAGAGPVRQRDRVAPPARRGGREEFGGVKSG
ncbi:MAG: GTP-binding protein, partial [Gammaproteobacteria bacterium]|nr:GTP-binding protein [Gammaproteobacteria bacterium]